MVQALLLLWLERLGGVSWGATAAVIAAGSTHGNRRGQAGV